MDTVLLRAGQPAGGNPLQPTVAVLLIDTCTGTSNQTHHSSLPFTSIVFVGNGSFMLSLSPSILFIIRNKQGGTTTGKENLCERADVGSRQAACLSDVCSVHHRQTCSRAGACGEEICHSAVGCRTTVHRSSDGASPGKAAAFCPGAVQASRSLT